MYKTVGQTRRYLSLQVILVAFSAGIDHRRYDHRGIVRDGFDGFNVLHIEAAAELDTCRAR